MTQITSSSEARQSEIILQKVVFCTLLPQHLKFYEEQCTYKLMISYRQYPESQRQIKPVINSLRHSEAAKKPKPSVAVAHYLHQFTVV